MAEGRRSERCPILTGRAWAFGLDLPASCIVPGGTAARDAPDDGRGEDPGRAGRLLTPVDPDFPGRVEPGDVLVAGSFGGGTADDAPIRAIRDAGIAAVVASSLDPEFARRSVRAGLPAVEVYEALVIHTGEVLRVDIEGGRVANLSSGDRYPIRNLDEETLEAYRRHFEDATSPPKP